MSVIKNSQSYQRLMSGAYNPQQDPKLGWANEVSEGRGALDYLGRADVRADMRAFYSERDGFNGTDEELIKKFYSDRTWRNVNTLSMAADVKDVYKMSPEQTSRLARIQKLYDALPNFYEEGGRGLGGLAQNITAGLLDPLNLVGGGSGKLAGQAAARAALPAAKAAVRAGNVTASQARSQIIRESIFAGVKAGAKGEALAGAGTGAAQDVLIQKRNTDLGIQDGFSGGSLVGNALFGGAIGGAFGGVFGGAGAAFGDQIDAMSGSIKKNMFGDYTSKYAEPSEQKSPAGVASDVDTAAAGKPVSTEQKDDTKVQMYISAQREQYQRHLDAIVDQIREESGDAGLANWQGSRLDDKAKTESMRTADVMRENRDALNELYKWPTMRNSYKQQRDALALNENPKPDVIRRINELDETLSRGDDAYTAIVRAAGDGKEDQLDEVVAAFARFKKDPGAMVMDDTGRIVTTTPEPTPAAPKADEAFAPSLDDATIVTADEPTLRAELDKIALAKDSKLPVDAAYEQKLVSRFKETVGADFVRSTPEPAEATDSTANEIPDNVSSEELIGALTSLDKRYNALSNQINRINKAIESGKAAPDVADKIKAITAEREQVNTSRKQMKDRLSSLKRVAEEPQEIRLPELTAEAEAAESPLDAEGVGSFLSEYGFDNASTRAELGEFLSKHRNTRSARTAAVRKFVVNKIRYARSVNLLEQVMDVYTEDVAFNPKVFRSVMKYEKLVPKDMMPEVMSRYEEWLTTQAPNIFSYHLAQNPMFSIDDIMALIVDTHGEEMADIVLRTMGMDADAIIQGMAVKRTPPGWDKLTKTQQETITKRMEGARKNLENLLSTGRINQKRLEATLEMTKSNMILDALYTDFLSANNASRGSSPLSRITVITDKSLETTVTGKTMKDTALADKEGVLKDEYKFRSISKSDKYGLQNMLRKSNQGLAKGIDEHGDLVIEFPFFGSLFVRDIIRNPDGSINYAKTVDDKYVLGKNGQMIRKTFDAAETANRAIEQASIERATNRMLKAKQDVGGIKKGERVTEKQLRGAQVEDARKSDRRTDINKRRPEEGGDESAEVINKIVRKIAIKEAVRNATEIAEDVAPAIEANIAQVEAVLGEPVTLAERDAAVVAVEAEDRAAIINKLREDLVRIAMDGYSQHQDVDALQAELKVIREKFTPQASAPKSHADKPIGAKHEPRIYVYKGWEVDVRNQFSYKKSSDTTTKILFLNEPVGDIIKNKDGTATVVYTAADGLEQTAKVSTLDAVAGYLPRLFEDYVMEAGASGKLQPSFDEATNSVYAIDWKVSNTWGNNKRTVPVETVVDKAPPIAGPVTDYKENLDVSAANLPLPEGSVLAVHILDGKFQGVTRVESTKATTPQTVGQILGKQNVKFTIGYVPAGTKSASREATRLFTPLDADGEVFRAGAADAGKKSGKEDEFSQISLTDTTKVNVDQNDLPVRFRDQGLTTLAKVHNLVSQMENTPWDHIADQGQYDQFVKDIGDLYEVRSKYAPKGIKLPTASRIVAMAQWTRAMDGYDPVTVSTGLDILRRLSFMDRDLPIIGTTDLGPNAGGYVLPTTSADDANRVFLNPAALNPDGKGSIIPQPVALVHELGHWAYMNILDDADRMQFWRSMGKYFADGALDMEQIRRRLPGISAEAEAMSPAEFFANQFSQWAITNGKVNNIPLWTKMARKIVSFAQALGVRISGDRGIVSPNLVDIDPDMAELFVKIMPEMDPMYDRFVETHRILTEVRKIKNDSHARTASLAADVARKFDWIRRDLESAIEGSDPNEIARVMDEATNQLYGMFGGKRGAKKHKTVPGKENTGQNRITLLDSKVGSSARARRTIMGAVYSWREFANDFYQGNRDISGKAELSTKDIEASESGDLGSSYDTIASYAYSFMDDDQTAALTMKAAELTSALSRGTDEMLAVISRVGQLDGTPIRVNKDGTIEAKAELSSYSKLQRRRGAAREEARTRLAIEEAMKGADGISNDAADRDHLPTTTEDAISSQAVSTMNLNELTAEYKSLAGQRNARKKDIEAELRTRITNMENVALKPVDDDLIDMPINALEKDLFRSIKRGKAEDTARLINALAYKKRAKPEAGILPPSSPKVMKAAKIVKEQNRIGTSDNGVPQNAPPQVRETIRAVTNRKRGEERNARMVASRFIAILGKGANSITEDGFVTKADLAKILGMPSGDDTPVTEVDQEFVKFREAMRTIGKEIRNPKGTAISEISRMALNAMTNPEDIAYLKTNIDELNAAFVSVMRNQGNLDDIFEDLPASSREKIGELYKENAEAVRMIAADMMTSKGRAEYQNMAISGDVMAALGNGTYTQLRYAGGMHGVYPSIASAYKAETIQNLPPRKRKAIEAFTGADANDSMLFAFEIDGSTDYLTEGVPNQPLQPTDGSVGKAVYLRKQVTPLDSEDIASLTDDRELIADISWLNARINHNTKKLATVKANIEMMIARGEDVSDYKFDVLFPLEKTLVNQIGRQSALMRMGKVPKLRAIPVFARANNMFRFGKADQYSFGSVSPNSLDWLVSKLEADNTITSEIADSIRTGASINGVDAHNILSQLIMKSQSINKAEASEVLNDALRELGYDGIDTGSHLALFNPDNIRHANDGAFDSDELMLGTMDNNSVRKSLSGDLLMAMTEGKVNRDDTSGLINTMQAMRAPAMLAEPMKKILKQKTPTIEDVNRISWFARGFSENSQRFRLSGANWFADKLKPANGIGFYEKKDAEIAKALMVSRDDKGRPVSVFTKMRKLPDSTNTYLRRWMNRNKFVGTVAQPQSHARIVAALRRGDEAINKLAPAEREVALDVRKFFKQELDKAIKAGLPMSYRKDYITQIWSSDAIKSDPAAFVMTMRNFFLREMQRGEVPTPAGRDHALVAEEKAKTLMDTLTSEGSDGVLLPDNALRARLEDPFFERVINLTPEDLPGAERFLVNDLEGILSKYADQITNRRLLTQEFGLGNHAVSTYLNIIVNGRDAVVDALRNTKTFAKDRRAADATMDLRVSETQEVISPVDGTEEDITSMVDEAIKMLGKTKPEWQRNKEKVRNFLINLQDPAVVAVQPEFAKRIDAIVNALAEFGGVPGKVDPTEINAMATMVSAVSKKPVDQGWTNSPSMTKFSRSMRTFNNVSLLAFTTLASIPDLAMPLIRSGNFGAMQKAWSNYMSDPHYREMARNVGVGVESVLHERLAHMYADTGSRVSNSFFNMTFLNQWTNVQREVASLVGFESFKAEAKRAQDLLARGMGGTPEYRKIERYLRRYGLEQYAAPGARVLDDPSEMVSNDQLRYALMRFTNEAIFAPNPNDIPLWAQNPVGMLVFQLKSYPLMMSRMSSYCLQEFKNGNAAPLGYLLAAGGVLGATSLGVRDVVQGRGDTDGDGKPDALFRERYASEGVLAGAIMRWYNAVAADLGLDVEAGGTMDMVLGWFAESLLVAGGFGLFADLMHTAVEQADNRDYGKMRTIGWLAGPSFSVLGDAVGVTQAIGETIFSEEPSNSTRRAAVRSVVQRLPVVGAIKPIREAAVDVFPSQTEGDGGVTKWW